MNYNYKSIFYPPARKSYRTGLLFTQTKNDDLSAMNVTKQSKAAPISKVEPHFSDRFCATLWCGVNRFRTLAEVNNREL